MVMKMDYIEISAKTVDDAITEAIIKLGTTHDKIEYEVIEKGSAGFLGINRKDAVIRARKKNDTNDNIRDFLESVFKAMGLTVTIQIEKEEDSNVVNVDLKGDDMGVLIGKRGQTLDALQYLTNLAVNKNSEEYVKVKIDTEDYRKRRRETLENLAKNIAYKVKRTKRPVSLEPMNPFERRVIHSTLQTCGCYPEEIEYKMGVSSDIPILSLKEIYENRYYCCDCDCHGRIGNRNCQNQRGRSGFHYRSDFSYAGR